MTHSGKVLVIDNDPDRAGRLMQLVENAGFTVESANNVANASSTLSAASELDVILSDLDLEDVSWGDTSRTLTEMNVVVPVIMFSDEASAENMMAALRLGASDFFHRPVENPEALFQSMDRCVRQRQMSRELRQSRRRLERANRELNSTVRVLEQDQQAGRQVQMRMLPATPLVLGDYVFSHTVIPSLYLSGDFTDYFTVGTDYVVFFMADVSGHGSSSAFATVLLKNLFARKRSDFLRRSDATVLSPVKMLELANKELLDLGADKFATMIVAVLDMVANRLTYSIAGHLPLPVLVSGRGAEYLSGGGTAVGMMPESDFSQQSIDLPDTFMLALFSDGILEILPPKNLIEKEQFFLDVFRREDESPATLVTRLGLDSVETAPDDIAALFLSKRL
ncbi:PP2C family protein-serine/threonine phosphatase [Chromatocurvus halotolerans]|uniref:Serine phosphatase RsbU (Regulator of sigma subunit) n=1 Tax=Chromatocurvus halotolerans TaxID=1132028 RepID=A0A4R2L356_9GAMM|nr:SpoIIE family protein phosphatase [Chromatocurvus halotolerans]TCO78359.1 serine phosphatase RsbU (regulator of sigma subunit) [Chromatocurvus halotolerans]